MGVRAQRCAPTRGAALTPSAIDPADHRKGPRRRGEVLERAILAAALEELAESGFGDLTMDRIAARAHTSKSVVYRRWPTRVHLLVEAWRRFSISAQDVPDTGSLRTDVLTLMRLTSDRLASHAGVLLRGLLAEMVRSPALAEDIREQAHDIGPSAVVTLLERAVARGDVSPAVLGSRRATVATDLLRNEFLLHGAPIPDAVLQEIVDDVYLPLVLAVR